MTARSGTLRKLVAAGLTAFLLGSCTTAPRSTDTEAQMAARPHMEQIADRYDQMRREMIDTLDIELGELGWRTNVDRGITWANCSQEGVRTDATDFGMVGLIADGTYDRADWHRSAELVLDIGRRYGFTETGTLLDREDDFEVWARDEYGARYHFGMAVTSILTLRTGCHLWDEQPGHDYARASPLDERGHVS